MTAKRCAISTIFLFAFIAIPMLSALDARDGLVRVTIDEMNGHVILYRLVNLAGRNKYEPLVYDADSTTSFLTVSVNGILYKMGDSREYRFSTSRIDSGAEVTFSTFGDSITQRVVFVRSSDSRVMNGFRIEYIIKNNSPSDIKVKLRQIWDTFLAENSGIHFATNVRARTTEEMQITRSSPETYIATPGEAASLALLLANIERPDNVILANWKRISDFPFDYDSAFLRGFTVAPYSMNDSAMALYWDEMIVPAGSSKTVYSFFISGGEGTEFLKQLSSVPMAIIGWPPKSLQIPVSTTLDSKLPALDIEAIQKLLSDIDKALANISAVSDNDVQTLLKRLGALENPAPSTDSPSK